MNKFEQELQNNNLVCSYCENCNKLVWPPSEFCSKCFREVIWKPVSRFAKLVEFSNKNKEYFCIAEFEGNIRVMGSIKNGTNLQIGQSLVLARCDFDGKEIFFFEPMSNT